MKILVLNGGGDCPGLNAVIRGIAKRAQNESDVEIWGSKDAFNGLFAGGDGLIKLNTTVTAGIHVKGGTILRTTNRGNPLHYPVLQPDGSVEYIDRSPELIEKLQDYGFDAIINIGGDGSQSISLGLKERGLKIIGVPKTIDNDLKATDFTFGFQTAVQIATDSFDKLVTTAESHHRVMIMEVMGREAGWIALHTAISGGAEVCLIPEIPYKLEPILKAIEKRYKSGRGFANIVIAEGAKPLDGETFSREGSTGAEHKRLGGMAYVLSDQLKAAGCPAEIRETVLGHVQRGGSPTAFDRALATAFGIRAMEMALKGHFGKMVAFRNNGLTEVNLEDAVGGNHLVQESHYLMQTARGLGICMGD